jgi:hypothetical protein
VIGSFTYQLPSTMFFTKGYNLNRKGTLVLDWYTLITNIIDNDCI